MSLLEIRSLNKSFGDVRVAQNIDFSVQKGEIFTLMGKSGSGKSSLLRMICGFERPDSGEIALEGNLLFSKSVNLEPKERELSMVFQNYALFPHLDVEQNILFGHTKREELDRLLKKVGILSIKKRYPHEISGGQQQRVALCRALIREPKLLLLDEPFSSVDGEIRAILRDELKEMIREFEITSIFVTHDREDAFFMSDKLALLADGEMLQVGEIKELYNNPISKEAAAFLGKVNSIGERFFRPESVTIKSDGEFEGEVVDSIFHGFYYISTINSKNNNLTIYTKEPLEISSIIRFNILY